MNRFLFGLMMTTMLWGATPGTLLLMNDSPYVLTARVYTQYGEFLGQATILSGQQSLVTLSLSTTPIARPGAPPLNITPYRVVWQCAGNTIYSVCNDGATGSLVRASLCPGQQICTSKKEEEKKESKSKVAKEQKTP
jgi:hypothetical protein